MLNSLSRAGSQPRQGLRSIVVRRKPGCKSQAIVQAGPLRFPAAIGRSGITAFKREGDGATPRASMRLLYGYFRAEPRAATHSRLPLRSIRADMLWCDAPGHPAYNRPVKAPFTPSHERLQRQDRLYDVCLVMDWNVTCRKQGCGSAIFFHVARPDYTPTEGCVAISPADMRRLLAVVSQATIVTVL
ncbi:MULTISPECIES: L,D-transpeptidase family protein [Rhizobium/Agrobacterium group]|uniref:L,D-transpeptidase family protein n=1 Tax=Rhizobium/Agrobacterium group TaxID=227290 RepID=UPI000B400DFF|nr:MULTISPECIES: L,D-transpeptidase family protein [Rhizobium/Agrobacterium group]MCF1484181.1 L,D-transpeptidase family protein [Allorhizobium ampelinum]NSZ44188.1 L,D-transpeptidase family protein [Agrobacterium vitis]NTA27935.1 L,D-transpeptidase family protein [Allorhizobium ampelinum]OVE93655.1 hypothetical protein B7W85_15685 [Allorhizobium ampelinum]